MADHTRDFAFAESEVDKDLCEVVVERLNVTPYCIDHRRRSVIFAELGADVDLSAAPFLYQRQFETARRLISLPYELVHRAAMGVPTTFRDLVFLYSVGRCGSTALSRVYRCVDQSYSLSEPDVFTNLSHLRMQGRITDADLLQLLGSLIRLLHRPPKACERLIVKFRAPCIDLSEPLHWLFPTAAMIFQYRNAIDCIDSRLRVFDEASPPSWARALSDSIPEAIRELGRLAAPAITWLGGVGHYLRMREEGIPIAALRYENLIADPGGSIEKLFAHCGIAAEQVARASEKIALDALEGTRVPRNLEGRRTITDLEVQILERFFADHVNLPPDAVLVGTLNN